MGQPSTLCAARPQGRAARGTPAAAAAPEVAVGRFATVLARDGLPALAPALAELCLALDLRSAAVRDGSGALLAQSGHPAQSAPTAQLPVPGPEGGGRGVLIAFGARTGTLPTLRAAAAVLGLILSGPTPAGPGALLDAAEDEADRLADRLHDGAVQDLVAARWAADSAVRGGDPAATRQAVQTALQALRRVVWQLRPRGADGLEPALAALSVALVESGRPPMTVLASAGAADALSPTASRVAYRLVQAVVCAGPDQAGQPVQVGLRTDGNTLVLTLHGGVLPPSDRWTDHWTDDWADHWARRLRAVGGDLVTHSGRLCVLLPLAVPPAPAIPDDLEADL